jgi:hypothetical protein
MPPKIFGKFCSKVLDRKFLMVYTIKDMVIDFTCIKRQQKVCPNFGIVPRYTNIYKGIKLNKRIVDIVFPKINKPAGINVFNQLYPAETQHSKILGELLSPKGAHNMGDKFLELFFVM